MSLREGQYRAKAVAWGWDTTQGGTLRFVVEFEVTRGAWAGTRDRLSLLFPQDGGDAVKRGLSQLRRLGWAGADLSTLKSANLGAAEVSIECRPEVEKAADGSWKPRLYRGKPQFRIEIMAPWRPKSEVAPERVAALAAKLRPMIDAENKRLGIGGEGGLFE